MIRSTWLWLCQIPLNFTGLIKNYCSVYTGAALAIFLSQIQEENGYKCWPLDKFEIGLNLKGQINKLDFEAYELIRTVA